MSANLTVRIQRDDFDAAAESAKLVRGQADVGAIVTFSGICRGGEGEDAIAAMHNWLLDRGADPARARRRILPGYAHQDLLWAETAWDEVYPLIGETLRQA